MKLVIFFFTLTLSVSAFARLTDSQQMAEAEKIAKNHRRELWRQGFEDVTSHVTKISKAQLDEYVSFTGGAEQPLNREEIASLYRCFNSPKMCSLFHVSLGYSMYGGSGETHLYLLMDPNSGKAQEIMHEVFAE